MTRLFRTASLVMGILTTAGLAGAQTPSVAPAEQPHTGGWDTILYPVYAWVPIFGADVRLPDQPTPPSGGSGGPAPATAQSAEELAKQTQNPIANLISVPFQGNWDFGLGDRDATGTLLNFQPASAADISVRVSPGRQPAPMRDSRSSCQVPVGLKV